MCVMEMGARAGQADGAGGVPRLPRVAVTPGEPEPAAGTHPTPPGKGPGEHRVTERHQPARGVVTRLSVSQGGRAWPGPEPKGGDAVLVPVEPRV